MLTFLQYIRETTCWRAIFGHLRWRSGEGLSKIARNSMIATMKVVWASIEYGQMIELLHFSNSSIPTTFFKIYDFPFQLSKQAVNNNSKLFFYLIYLHPGKIPFSLIVHRYGCLAPVSTFPYIDRSILLYIYNFSYFFFEEIN